VDSPLYSEHSCSGNVKRIEGLETARQEVGGIQICFFYRFLLQTVFNEIIFILYLVFHKNSSLTVTGLKCVSIKKCV